MAVNVSDKDKGWRKVVRSIGDMEQASVMVGVHDGEVAEYAAYNEFGTKNIPERSFMRSAFDENLSKLTDFVGRLYGGVVDGKIEPDVALGLLGEQHQNQIKAKVRSNVPPPNAPSTVRRKGSSKTLIDTRRMSQSIRWVVEPGKRAGFLRRVIRWEGRR